MAHHDSTIPFEVLELVIYDVAQEANQTARYQALSSIALCSWAFKHLAHKHLFAKVYLYGSRSKSGTPRIRRLVELINDDPHSEVTGIASYIKDLSVHMLGAASMVRPTLDDGTMSILFGKIFNTGEPASGARSLSMSLGNVSNLRRNCDWSTLSQDFRDAFHKLCRKPLLTTLSLSGFVNLPPNLLVNTSIKSVKLVQIRLLGTESHDFSDPPTFLPASDEEVAVINDLPFPRDQVVFLESVHTDQSFPLLEVLDMTPRRSIPPAVVFSHLNHLILEVRCAEDLEEATSLLGHELAYLERLEINLNYLHHVTEPLFSVGLPCLKSLAIKHNSVTYKNPGISVLNQICLLLDKPPATLQKIEVTFFLFSRPEDRTVEDIFEGHEYGILDELFSHPKFYCLKYLKLCFLFNLYTDRLTDTRQFQKAASAYVRRALPEVNSATKSGPLELDVIISPFQRCMKYS